MTEGHFPHDFESEMKALCLRYEYMISYASRSCLPHSRQLGTNNHPWDQQHSSQHKLHQRQMGNHTLKQVCLR